MFLLRIYPAMLIALLLLGGGMSNAYAGKVPSLQITKQGLRPLWQKVGQQVLPMVLLSSVLLSAPPTEAYDVVKDPELVQVRATPTNYKVGKHVYFRLEGLGYVGEIVSVQANKLEVSIADGGHKGTPSAVYIDQVEAVLDWNYEVIGSPVRFFVDGAEAGLPTEKIVTRRVTELSKAGEKKATFVDMYIDDTEVNVPAKKIKPVTEVTEEGVEKLTYKIERHFAHGIVSATTEDGRYVIKPYYVEALASEPHNANSYPHVVFSPLRAKHYRDQNEGLYLVSQQYFLRRNAPDRLRLEDTTLFTDFFFSINAEKMRSANAAALQAGLPLPYDDKVLGLPLVTDYHLQKFSAADFVGRIIFYHDTERGFAHLAHAIGQRDGAVEVRAANHSKKLVAVDHIRGASVPDHELLGRFVSFVTSDAYPLNYVQRVGVHYDFSVEEYIPGERPAIWTPNDIRHAPVAVVLDNNLLVVKVLASTDEWGWFPSVYHLYLVGEYSIIHTGNHHHLE